MAPTLGASGPFRVGEVAEIRLTAALPGAAILTVGLAEAAYADFPFAGLDTYVASPILLKLVPVQGPPLVAGAGKLKITVNVDTSLAGVTLYLQAFVLDPAMLDLFTSTNGLELAFGQ